MEGKCRDTSKFFSYHESLASICKLSSKKYTIISKKNGINHGINSAPSLAKVVGLTEIALLASYELGHQRDQGVHII